MEHNLKPEELDAWESFEVGSYEEVEEIRSKFPNSIFLEQLHFLSLWAQGDLSKNQVKDFRINSPSPLMYISQAVAQGLIYQVKESWALYQKHIKQKNPLYCASLIKFGVQIALDNFAYEACLQIIRLDKSPNKDSFYAEEILICFYNLKKFTEVIQHFKKNFKFIPETQQLYFMVGMSLLGLGMYREAELMLGKQKALLNLPSYEEKKQEFLDKIDSIPVLEKKNNLSVQEMQDLGFAYLFTAQYKKAEEIFKRELSVLTVNPT